MNQASIASKTPSGTFRDNLKHDLPASLVVFLVALPLSMGIAIASGASPAAGLVSGMVGGLLVGLLAGSPMQVSGPAAGLSVIVFQLIQQHGLDKLAIIIVLAGLIQVMAGLLRVGQWFRAVSPAVIKGMLAGIGVLIFASQFHVMVDDKPRSTGLENIASIPTAIWRGLTPSDSSSHHLAAMIGMGAILVMVLWKTLAPRQLRGIPAPLAAIAIVTIIATAANLPIQRVPVPDRFADLFRLPDLGVVDWSQWRVFLAAAGALALVASAETLLCCGAVDQMHRGPRTNYDREMIAQGVGNVTCGALGGLPMTGVIVRSAANVDAGARTRASATLHGAWMLMFVALLPGVLRMIPTAGLAAILVFTGYKLFNPGNIRQLAKFGKSEVAIYAITVIAIVTTDLLTGVVTGLVLSAIKLLYVFTHLRIVVDERPNIGRTDIQLHGAATFLRLPNLAAVLERVTPDTKLHVHLDGLSYVDHACLDLLMNWEKQHEAAGGRLIMDWDRLTAMFHGDEADDRGNARGVPRGGGVPRQIIMQGQKVLEKSI